MINFSLSVVSIHNYIPSSHYSRYTYAVHVLMTSHLFCCMSTILLLSLPIRDDSYWITYQEQDRLTQWSYYNRMVKIHSLLLLPLHWVRQDFSIQWSCLSLKNLACYSLLVFPPYNAKVSLKHNKFIYILVCREKQPHKKDRIFFLKIDNHKNKSRTFFWK